MSNTVTTSVFIGGRIRKGLIYDKVRRLERYPEFMPDVKSVKVLESGHETGASEWNIEIEGCPLFWRERDWFDNQRHVFSFESFEGDFDEFTGRWEVSEAPGGAKVEFSLGYCVGIPVIEDVIGPVLQVKLRRNAQKMLEDLKREVEAISTDEERASRRAEVDLPARITLDTEALEGRLVNLSETGAAVELPAELCDSMPAELELSFPGCSSPVIGKVVWAQQATRTAGVRFVQAAERILPTEVIRELLAAAA